MNKSEAPRFSNRLLLALSHDDFGLLHPHFEPVELALRQPLENAHSPVRYVYFIESGLASMVARSPLRKEAEVGLIGNEGMTGASVVLEDDSPPFETFVQMAGMAFRIRAEHLRAALAQSQTLRSLLLRYARALWIQTSYTALANAQTKLDARLARWLLMVRDRVDSDTFELTHEFMAVMLAVRRPGVTVALHELEGKGLIRSLRSTVIIRDREGLQEMADGTYTLAEEEYERLVGVKLLRQQAGSVS